MQSSTGSILLKAAALLFAVTLSGLYIASQWPSDTPANDGPTNQPAADPLTIDPTEPADPPSVPNFDLNEALSKTGTVKPGKLFEADKRSPEFKLNPALPKSSPLEYNIGNFIGDKKDDTDASEPANKE